MESSKKEPINKIRLINIKPHKTNVKNCKSSDQEEKELVILR